MMELGVFKCYHTFYTKNVSHIFCIQVIFKDSDENSAVFDIDKMLSSYFACFFLTGKRFLLLIQNANLNFFILDPLENPSIR